jgi:hypothetical protein
MRGGGGLAGSQPMSTAVHTEPNKLWRPTVTPYLTYSLIDVKTTGKTYQHLSVKND